MQTITLYFHIIGALLLVGGMLFFTLIAAPYLRSLKDEKESAIHFQGLGKRFKTVGLLAWAMLLITGALNLYQMEIELSSELLNTSYGQILIAKLTLVLIVITSSIIHDFYIGPKSRNNPKLASTTKIIGRSNLILTLIIVYFAVKLHTGV